MIRSEPLKIPEENPTIRIAEGKYLVLVRYTVKPKAHEELRTAAGSIKLKDPRVEHWASW
jgi:hypothetical protein